MEAWLKRIKKEDIVIRIVPGRRGSGRAYTLLPAHELSLPALGQILFDKNGYWIYDGDELYVDEQEQIAAFIAQHQERLM